MRQDILATAGLDASNFDKGVEKLEAGGKRVEKSMRGGSRAMQNFGFQIQDVAVQAEMGTDALRILGQQGSQVLGPMTGAVVAVSAGIARWALGVGETNKRLEETEARINKSKESVEDLIKTIEASRGRTINNLNEIIGGKEFAQRENLEADFKKEAADLDAKAAEAVDKRTKAERRLAEVLEIKRRSSEHLGVEDTFRDTEITAIRKEINQQAQEEALAIKAREQREREYNSEIRKIEHNAEQKRAEEKAKAAEKEADEKKKALEEQADQARKIGGMLKKEAEKALKEEEKRQKDLEEAHKKIHAETLRREKERQREKTRTEEEAARASKKLAEDVARAQKEANEKTGEEFNERVRQKMLTPSQRAAERAQQRKVDRASRSVETQDRIRNQNRARGAYGQRSINQISDSKSAASKAAFIKRNAPKITAASIEASTITVTQLKPK